MREQFSGILGRFEALALNNGDVTPSTTRYNALLATEHLLASMVVKSSCAKDQTLGDNYLGSDGTVQALRARKSFRDTICIVGRLALANHTHNFFRSVGQTSR